MKRPLLSSEKIDQGAIKAMTRFHSDTVAEVERAISSHPVVVIGMAGNPFVGRARKALDRANVPFHFISYGSYLSGWKKRLAIKLWSGWPTFPQVFVKGVLIGGCWDMEKLIAEKKLGYSN